MILLFSRLLSIKGAFRGLILALRLCRGLLLILTVTLVIVVFLLALNRPLIIGL